MRRPSAAFVSFAFLFVFTPKVSTAAPQASPATSIATPSGEESANPHAHPWTIELNATLLGDYNGNNFNMAKEKYGGRSTDLGLDIAVRKNLTRAISTGPRISFYSATAGGNTLSGDGATYNDGGITIRGIAPTAFVFPLTWSARLQADRFLNQSMVTPWLEAEGGLSIIEVRSLMTGITRTFTRPAARASAGFDLQPFATTDRFFLSARASYLALSSFSNYQFAAGSGLRF